MDAYEGFLERYRSGQMPWDERMPPPEVIAIAEILPPGRMIDIGCGFGRTAIYMSQKGWEAIGIDYVPEAIEGARQRAAALDANVTFLNESTIDMPYLEGPFDLAVDVGCMHSFSDEERDRHIQELARLLAPGATYMLFAHLKDENDDNPPGRNRPTPALLQTLLAPWFTLERQELGTTQVEDKPPWLSGWFWWKRK